MKLKPFQEEGRDYLAGKRYALLADQMRLGKTGQAIHAAARVEAKTILVICPAVAITMWERAFKQWWPQQRQPMVEVISYNKASACREEYCVPWDVLIIDESHYLKSIDAARTKAVLGRNGIARSARRVWALSGTPSPNHAAELWPLLYTFGATKLHYETFARRYCNVDPYGGRVVGTKKAMVPELRKILGKVMLRRTKDKVAPELPPCIVTEHHVTASDSFLDLAWPVDSLCVANLDKAAEADIRLRKMLANAVCAAKLDKAAEADLRLRKVLANAGTDSQLLECLDSHVDEMATLRRVTALLKAPALTELLRFELDSGMMDKCVVYGYHSDAMRVMSRLLGIEGYKVDLLYGGTPKKRRDAMLGRFDRSAQKGGTQILFANILAAGVAIDLSAAHDSFFIEEDWVPGNNAQAMERLGGYRQKHPIHVRVAVLKDSADEIVSSVLARKSAELSNIYVEVE